MMTSLLLNADSCNLTTKNKLSLLRSDKNVVMERVRKSRDETRRSRQTETEIFVARQNREASFLKANFRKDLLLKRSIKPKIKK